MNKLSRDPHHGPDSTSWANTGGAHRTWSSRERSSPTSRGGVARVRVRAWMLPAGVIVLGMLELALLIAIGMATSLWWSVLIVVLGWLCGCALVIAASQQSVARLKSVVQAFRGTGPLKDRMSRPVFTALAAFLFFFPGLISDVIAVVLLLTPVQERAVRASGLKADAARRVLWSRQGPGIIESEIVVDSRPTPDPARHDNQ